MVEIIKKRKYVQLNKNQKKDVFNLYINKNISTPKIAKRYSVATQTICNILRKNNIKINKFSELKSEWKINDNFFKEINSQEKAYFLGFLFADGTNNIKNYHVAIRLSEIDKEILEKFNQLLEYNKPLIYYPDKTWFNKNTNKWIHTKPSFGLIICRKKISLNLNRLGMIPNKSAILQFPDYLDEKLYSHFIRGYFDGDGSLCYKKTKYWQFNIASSKFFIKKLEYIFESKSLNYSVNYEKTSILTISKKQHIEKILDWVYKDANIYLQRKYNKYIQFKNSYSILPKGLKIATSY